jgi:hypothetical protein
MGGKTIEGMDPNLIPRKTADDCGDANDKVEDNPEQMHSRVKEERAYRSTFYRSQSENDCFRNPRLQQHCSKIQITTLKAKE